MVRKGNTSRRGFQRGVQKGPSTKKFKPSLVRRLTFLRKILDVYNLPQVAASSFDILCRTCTIFNLVPFYKTLNGNFELESRKGLCRFWLLKFMSGCLLTYRVWVTANYFGSQEVSATSLLTVVHTLTFFDNWFIGIWDPVETVAILNESNNMMEYLKRKRRREFHLFGDIGLCIKVLAVIMMIPVVTLSIAIVNGMLYGSLPTSWLRLIEVLVDMRWMDRICWQLIFLPLELLSALPSVMTAAVVCITAFMSLGTMKVAGEDMRSMEVMDLDRRAQVERAYVCWQLSCNVVRFWCKIHVVPIVAGISCAATIYIFVAIKYTNLPLLVYLIFPVAGVVNLILLGLGLNDAVVVNHISERILVDQLMTFEADKLKEVRKASRRNLLQRTKAFQPISLPIGSFTEIRFDVIVTIWEEIVNQVLMLLSF